MSTGYRPDKKFWVPMGTDGYRVPTRKKILGNDGYRVPEKFSLIPTLVLVILNIIKHCFFLFNLIRSDKL